MTILNFGHVAKNDRCLVVIDKPSEQVLGATFHPLSHKFEVSSDILTPEKPQQHFEPCYQLSFLNIQ